MCQYQPAVVCKQSLVERDWYRLSSHQGAFKRWQKVLHLACTHTQHLSDLSQFHPPRSILSAHVCCLLVCACACHIKNNEIPILSLYQCSPSPKTSRRSDGVQWDIDSHKAWSCCCCCQMSINGSTCHLYSPPTCNYVTSMTTSHVTYQSVCPPTTYCRPYTSLSLYGEPFRWQCPLRVSCICNNNNI